MSSAGVARKGPKTWQTSAGMRREPAWGSANRELLGTAEQKDLSCNSTVGRERFGLFDCVSSRSDGVFSTLKVPLFSFFVSTEQLQRFRAPGVFLCTQWREVQTSAAMGSHHMPENFPWPHPVNFKLPIAQINT